MKYLILSYTAGVIATLILFYLDRIGIYTKKRRKNRRYKDRNIL